MEHRLTIPHKEFFTELGKYQTKFLQLHNSEELDYHAYYLRVDNLKESLRAYIKNHITHSQDVIEYIFDDYYWIESLKFQEHQSDQDKISSLLERSLSGIEQVIGYLTQIESLNDDFQGLELHSISEKTDFVLNQLNKVFGDEKFSISIIFELNKIKYRENETIEIVSHLAKKGHVIGDWDSAKISVKGAAYIEKKNFSKRKNKADSAINQRLDSIIEKLIVLGYGQEIIFEELEELRELQFKLSKKTWAQLLRGKLLDLALSKVISLETVEEIYKQITNDSFKLLS